VPLQLPVITCGVTRDTSNLLAGPSAARAEAGYTALHYPRCRKYLSLIRITVTRAALVPLTVMLLPSLFIIKWEVEELVDGLGIVGRWEMCAGSAGLPLLQRCVRAGFLFVFSYSHTT